MPKREKYNPELKDNVLIEALNREKR